MIAAFAANESPDCAYVNTDMIWLFGSKKMLLPLDDIISPEDLADYPEGMVTKGIRWNGELVMIPCLWIAGGRLYNKTIMQDLGYDPEKPPYKWPGELSEFAEKAKAKGIFGWGYRLLSTDYIQMTQQAGGHIFNEDATACAFNSPEGLETFTFIVDMWKNGWVSMENLTLDANAGATGLWQTGKQAMSDIWDSRLVKTTKQEAPDLVFGNQPVWENKMRSTAGGCGCWGIFRNTKNAEAASTWLNFLIEPEVAGFYDSVASFPPPRSGAYAYWVTDPETRSFVEDSLEYAILDQDSMYYFMEASQIIPPQLQAAVLGQKTVQEALDTAEKDLNDLIVKALADMKAQLG